MFPVTFLNNADVELYKQKIIVDDNSKKKTVLHNYDMDAVRDTGLHWEIINQILDQQDTCAIDPFAQELLAEYLSIYITYIIQVKPVRGGWFITTKTIFKIITHICYKLFFN